jgi:hypothetical protein|nr:DUF3857 domain-containing protein [Candidatus Krumholzibacteria bacterium]
MKRILIFAIALVMIPAGLLAAGMGQSAGHDLDALWARAQSTYNLDQEDAVILLDSRQVSVGNDQTLHTRVHRVVWIGTAVGIRTYADLRLPWNTTTTELKVETLRTWREGRWWPDESELSDTAIVHTLPHALDKADDYTTMRETMLLHDGVELGCIMEKAYTFTTREVPGHGEIHVFAQADPVVHAELRVMTSSPAPVQHAALNGVPEPQDINPTKGSGLLWVMENVPALGLPHTGEPQVYEPAVVWTTWRHWKELGTHWVATFRAAMTLGDEQKAGLQAKLNPAMSDRQKVEAVGEYLNTMVRRVSYDDSHWTFAPRPASRTLATAYGHDLDRAVLAAALLEAAGFTAEPILVSEGTTLLAETFGRLDDMNRVMIRIPEINDGLLDPTTGARAAYDAFYGHPFWYLAAPGGARPHDGDLKHSDKSLTFSVTLSRNDEGAWNGSGQFQGTSLFSNYSGFVTDEDVRAGHTATLVGAVLPGAEPSQVTLTSLLQERVAGHFQVKDYSPEADALKRSRLQLGDPGDGVLGRLPGDVHLYEAARQTPVLGVGDWAQTMILRCEVAEEDILHRPRPVTIENAAGWFQLEVDYRDGALTVSRKIKLAPGNIAPRNWPALRALLLAESDPAHGLIIFK